MAQDLATGDDGKVKQAKPIALDEFNEAKIKGIVTYPGGDRIDWRSLELPKDGNGKSKIGTLSLRLTWAPPRPGLAVGVDVFDQYGRKVASEQGRHGDDEYRRDAAIANAQGTYLIRVYAPLRGDAGKYKLKLEFDEVSGTGNVGFPPPATIIPDPPRLAAVPEPVVAPPPVACDDMNFRTTKGCENYCPTTPDVEIRPCQKIMPCQPWDSRIRKCKGVPGPVCPTGVVSTTCEAEVFKPEKAKVANLKQQGSVVVVTFNVKRGHKIDKGWKGYLLDGKTKVAGSDFVVTKTAEREVWGEVRLTTDQIDGKTAVISPP